MDSKKVEEQLRGDLSQSVKGSWRQNLSSKIIVHSSCLDSVTMRFAHFVVVAVVLVGSHIQRVLFLQLKKLR